MNHQSFRNWAHRMADWMADYFENVEDYPVKPDVRPGDVKRQLPETPPVAGEPMERIFQDFQDIIMPGMTHWQHPNFMAYFPASRSAPSVLAEMLTATLGAQCMIWFTSPAAEELEERCMEWLRQMCGLPASFTGSIQETASASNLIALLMARERLSRFRSNREGLYNLPKMRVYASEHIHSSVNKAVRIAGFGEENLVLVPTDESYAMDAEALEHAIQEDVRRGYAPACVVAAIGTTSSTALDPIRPIGEICRKYNCFFHIDAAYAGTALLLPEMRWMSDGIELADSFVFNPHKWMFVNFDCSAFYVKDTTLLINTFAITPEYLRTAEDREVNNYRDWGIQLGRRFRALKLWFVIRSFGVEGIREKLRLHLRIGQWLEDQVKAETDFELLAPVPLNLVCFRYRPKGKYTEQQLNALNEKLLAMLNDSGEMLLTQTKLNGKYTIRLVAGQTETTLDHVQQAWEKIVREARALEVEG